MAIQTVPQISGPNFGGVIYGLNFNVGFSNEPSKLTLDIVNKNGIYTPPSLNSSVSIGFGSFQFNGIVWSYNLKTVASEKVLQVTLVDRSIILDRTYVLLWKRGLFNELGKKTASEKKFNFNDESILVPVKRENSRGFPYTTFEEKTLGNIVVSDIIKYDLPFKNLGNLILVGRETIPNNSCDIPDTYYHFNDLRSAIGGRVGGNFPSDGEWRGTHEGTLREVLSNWAADLGFDFYWDYRSDQLVFYDISRGIQIPSINESDPKIISIESSQSLEGTFAQYGIAYTAAPKESAKTVSISIPNNVVYTVSPIPLDFLAKRLAAKQELNVSRSTWGGGRSKQEFITSALLGYVCKSLRNFYCFDEGFWEPLGFNLSKSDEQDLTTNTPDDENAKSNLLTFLRKSGFQSMIGDLETFDDEDLPNYDLQLISYDEALSNKWFEFEQLLLTYIGKYYRIPDTSGSFFFCNDSVFMQIETSVEPEGTAIEDDNIDFQGKKIFDRGGRLSHDQASAKDELKYETLIQDVQNCSPILVNLKESGLSDILEYSNLITKDSRFNSIVIFPKFARFVREKIGFRTQSFRGNNDLEITFNDIKKQNLSNSKKNCDALEDNVKRNSCISYEEFARNMALKKLTPQNDSDNLDDLVSGLVTKSADGCTITLRSGSVRLLAPSDDSYQVICRYNISVTKISSQNNDQLIYSAGNVGTADDVAEIRVINQNVTDPEQDTYKTSRSNGILYKPKDLKTLTPLISKKIVFAGEPSVPLNATLGLSSLDVSLSSDGFTTTVTYSNRPPKPSKANSVMRVVNSQFNRSSFNSG